MGLILSSARKHRDVSVLYGQICEKRIFIPSENIGYPYLVCKKRKYTVITVVSGNIAWPFMLRTLNSETTCLAVSLAPGDSILLCIQNTNLHVLSLRLQFGGNL